ncbi:Lrp/AsnC family transcriptional regulator [Haliangium ochraceum]|uniref:Transcriptional regulator, AsnC family n=1 Tax=Haliangium ochraceum (strain DSM 14365 / JCM 11303 / SMP-2) TaxID=502025 RepID=D0LRN2_HALO1|nr:Lrp/AsnC family transcriptional regulator [Haliangium ochraceum]ACY19024.1 transcriptional regulator, AsnC family [Haliangium ochraceum DSM 14365]
MKALDRIDLVILGALQDNARLSNKELAGIVGIAQSTCLERVRRLQEHGVLLGAHAAVAPHAIGVGLQAMISVRLSRHSQEHVASFRSRVLALPEVMGFFYMAGATDFLVHVAVRDSAHLRDLALETFSSHDDVAHIETSLIFEHVASPVWPILVESED